MRSRRDPEGTKNETQEVVVRPIRVPMRTRTAPMGTVLGALAHVVCLVPGVAMAVRASPSISFGWAL